MRKDIALILTVPFLLASCAVTSLETETSETSVIETSETTVTETSATETEITYALSMVDDEYAWQLQMIFDNADVWEMSEEDGIDSDWYCSYAITDLDNDGLLEVCKRAEYSNGPQTRLWMYEVIDDMSIVRLESEVDDGLDYVSSNYPDFENHEPLEYYQDEDGVFYLVHDCKSYGLTSVYNNYGVMALVNNRITINDVCFLHSENADAVITYFDGDGNEISEEEYNQLFEEYEGLATGEVYIEWFYEPSMDNLIESFEVWNSNDISSAMPVTIPTTTPTAIPESLNLQEQDLSSYVSDIGGSSVYHVPQLLIEGEYASQVNAEILWIYESYAQEQDRHYTGSEYIAFLSDGGCLSLVFVEQGIWDDDVYHVYNIDVNTGSRVTNEQIAEMAGVTDIGQAAEDAVLQYIDMYLPSPMLDEQMEYTLSEENLNADMMIGLTSESEMFFVSEVSSLGGASYYYEIYDEDGNDLLHLDFWVAW